MPTASGYITVTGQIVSVNTDWTNPTNVGGAPDTNVAEVSLNDSLPETLLFTHGLTLPSGSVVSAVRITLRCIASASEQSTFSVKLSGSASEDEVLRVGGESIPVVQLGDPPDVLKDLQVEDTDGGRMAACTSDRVNDGSGEIRINPTFSLITIKLDSVLLEIDYTVSRNVAAYCNRKFVKSPLIQLP